MISDFRALKNQGFFKETVRLSLKMVNEDIITALKNAINRGETLESAMEIMINSGYNPRDVQEASQFVGGGVLSQLQAKPDEHLTTPSPKSSFKKLPTSQQPQPVQQLQQPQQPQQQLQQPSQQVQPPQLPKKTLQPQQPQVQPQQPQMRGPSAVLPALPNDTPQKPPAPPQQTPIQRTPFQTTGQASKPLSKQLEKIRPEKPTRSKEIVLLLVLLLLIAVLILTIVFREKILGLFTGGS
jgi:hypothetical protein